MSPDFYSLCTTGLCTLRAWELLRFPQWCKASIWAAIMAVVGHRGACGASSISRVHVGFVIVQCQSFGSALDGTDLKACCWEVCWGPWKSLEPETGMPMPRVLATSVFPNLLRNTGFPDCLRLFAGARSASGRLLFYGVTYQKHHMFPGSTFFPLDLERFFSFKVMSNSVPDNNCRKQTLCSCRKVFQKKWFVST